MMRVKPMGMLLMILAGWINQHQQDVMAGIRVSLVQVSANAVYRRRFSCYNGF